MLNVYEENKKLEQLIDPKSQSVFFLAGLLQMSPDKLMELLSEAFDQALTEGTIISDNSNNNFTADICSNRIQINIKDNADLLSDFPGYLNFAIAGTSKLQTSLFVPKKQEYQQAEQESQNALLTKTECADSAPELPDSLDDGVYLQPDNLLRLNRFVNGINEMPSEALVAQLKQGYLTAKQNDELSAYGDAYNFDTGIQTQQGFPVIAAIRPNTAPINGAKWRLNYVGYQKTVHSVNYTSYLTEFAEISRKNYEELAALARPEKWYFAEDTDHIEILVNYISYTFYRLKSEGKIAISEKHGFAAFHTGLAHHSSLDDIYLCFRTSQAEDGPKWKCVGSCTAGSSTLGKMLVNCFNPLPQQAQYLNRLEDIVFDINRSIYLDMEHILLERLHRIPLDFLRCHIGGDADAMQLITAIEQAAYPDIQALYDDLETLIQNKEQLFQTLKNAMQAVLNMTIKKLRWNFRLAIPSYYPKKDTMSLLLPLDFTNSGNPQAALVVQLAESGVYIGHTILSMKHAYLDARLISSQESSWLIA